MNRSNLSACIALAALIGGAATPARADGAFSVYLGPQFATQSQAQNIGGNTLLDFGAGYDFIHAPIVPVQASFQFDYAHGADGGGSLDETGFGGEARLTTPLYAGLGLRVINTSFNNPGVSAGLLSTLHRNTSASFTGVGTDFFIGDRVFSLPGGVSFSLQATYKDVPAFDGINPSNFGVGIRAQL